MITLLNVFEESQKIVDLAKKFGYTGEIKILLDPLMEKKFYLNFLMKEDKEKSVSYKSSSLLSAKLSSELNCKVKVTVYDNISDLYKYDIDSKSSLITDKNSLIILFDDKFLDSIVFVDLEEAEKFMQEILLKQAEEFLQQNVKPTKGLQEHGFLSTSTDKTNEIASKKQKLNPKLEFNKENHSIILEIPISKDVECDQKMLADDIAKDTANKYLEEIGKFGNKYKKIFSNLG